MRKEILGHKCRHQGFACVSKEQLEEEVRFSEFIYNHTEISVAVSLLRLIDNPRRNIPLLSVLNSFIFRFTPECLAEIRALHHQDCCFYDAMVLNSGSDCAGFIREIGRFRTCFQDMPVHILLENLYRETHVREIFGSMKNGETRLENLDALSDKAIHSDTLSENMRLLYVGMTRARDKLIMTMEIDEEKLSDLKEDSKSDIDAGKVLDKNCMAEWLLLATLSRSEAGALAAEKPGTANGGGWAFNRWVYDSKNEHEQSRESENPLDEETQEVGRHSYTYVDIANLPARLSPSQMDGQYVISGNQIRETDAPVVFIPGTAGTDSFPFPESLDRSSDLSPEEKGTATHKVMQYIDIKRTGCVEDIKNEIARLEKEKYTTQEEAESAVPEAVFRFFSSKVGKQLLRASECHREYSFSFLLPWEENNSQEESLIHGTIGCWFISNNGEITALDFKTNQIPDPGRYTEQIKSYTRALESTLNWKVSHSILYFFFNNQAYSPENNEMDKWDWQPITEL